MDHLENTFNFNSPEDIQFDLDSINISDQPNSSIFLLHFIKGLITEKDGDLSDYIQKLYDEGSYTNVNNINYFNLFNEKTEIMKEIEKVC